MALRLQWGREKARLRWDEWNVHWMIYLWVKKKTQLLWRWSDLRNCFSLLCQRVYCQAISCGNVEQAANIFGTNQIKCENHGWTYEQINLKLKLKIKTQNIKQYQLMEGSRRHMGYHRKTIVILSFNLYETLLLIFKNEIAEYFSCNKIL